MADIAVLGIGLDTRQGEVNAKSFTSALGGIQKQSKQLESGNQSLTQSFVKSQLAVDVYRKGIELATTVISSSIQTGMKFEATMSKVAATSNASAKQLKQMTQAAKDLGATTEFSASQAAEGLVLLSQAGLSAEQSVAALPEVLNLASAGNLSLAESSDIATNAMSSMRLGVESLGHITDVFAKTASSSNTNVQMMGESFTYAGSVAASSGVQIEELSALIGVLGNAGIQGSMAGTQLAAAFTKSAKEGKNFVDWLEELEKQGATTAEVMDIFGERAGRGALAILGQGVQTVRDFTEELKKSDGAALKMAKTMNDNLAGDIKSLNSVVEDLQLSFYDTFGQETRDVVQGLTMAIRENKEEILDLAFNLKEAVEKIVVPLATGLGTIAKVVRGDLSEAFNYWKAGVTDFFTWSERKKEEVIQDTQETIKNSKAIKNNSSEIKENTSVTIENLETTKQYSDNLDLLDQIYAKNFDSLYGLNQEKENQILANNNIVDSTNDLINAVENESIAVEKIADSYTKATEEAQKFASATARPNGTFSGSSLVGQTFSIVTPTKTTASQVATSYTGSSTSTYSNDYELEKVKSLLQNFESLAGDIASYLNTDQALDIKLADAREELRNVTLELSSLSQDELEKQLELTKEAFNIQKNIDNLENDIAKQKLKDLEDQKKTAEGLNDILGSVLSDYKELETGDLSQVLPVDKLKALENQFLATSQAIDSIDWSDITTADEQLIAQFQNISKEFLAQAEEVFKSSDNYQVIKQNVTSEFDDLAQKLVTSMAAADPTVFEENLSSLSSQFVNNENVTKILDNTMKSLESNTDNAETNTTGLSQALAGTQSPLSVANENFNTIAQNTASTVDFIASKFANLQAAIESGSDTVGGGDTVTTTPTKSFSHYTNVNGNYSAIYSDGSKDLLLTPIQGNTNIMIAGSSLFYKDYMGAQHEYVNGVRAYATGSFNINEDQNARLHAGEMVIRSEDRPAVQDFLSESGRASTYGGQNTSFSQNRAVELLSELVDLLKNMPAPKVFLNARKVSEELLYSQGVRA